MSDNKTLAERVRIFFAYGGPIDILSDKGRSLIEKIAALEAEVARLRAAAEKGAAAERERIPGGAEGGGETAGRLYPDGIRPLSRHCRLHPKLARRGADRRPGGAVRMNWSEQMEAAIMQQILDNIRKADLVKVEYGSRLSVPRDLIHKVWSQIDWDAVATEVSAQIQDRIASTIAQSMMTEAKTDAKKVLSIDGVRQRIRAEVYPKIMQALEEATP